VALVIFAGASFFFALAETALFSLGRWRARQMAEQEGSVGRMVLRLLDAPEDLLATIVLGNTLANAAVVAIALGMSMHGAWPFAVSVPLALLLVLVWGEVIPKTLAVRDPDRWARRVARPMAVLTRLSGPLRHVVQRLIEGVLRVLLRHTPAMAAQVTVAEYQDLLELAFQQGTLARSEKEIILQILSMDRKTVQEVMRPRSRMACISDDLSVEEMVAEAKRFKHGRLPMYDETPDTIVGVLNTRKLLLDPARDLAEAIEFPSFVPATMNLLQLFRSLQQQQRGLAIVLDEFGGTAGMVTMEDILAEMVGGFHREAGDEGFVMERLAAGQWRVSGLMRLDDFRREYAELGEMPGVETMGGLMVSLLGYVPAPGERAVYRGLQMTAQQADGRRVKEVLVEVIRRRSTEVTA
jgi:CBS domain containing-hemolysin-like protein